MKLKTNPRYNEFVRELKKSSRDAVRWAGITFRSVVMAYAKEHKILDGQGSMVAGGRWNPPEAFPVIYSSLRPGTAVEEAFGLTAYFGMRETDLRPRATVGLAWKLEKLLDLTTPDLLDRLDLVRWLREDFRTRNREGFETPVQAFGRACHTSKITGILCPSAFVSGGVNLVVFKDHLRPPSSASVIKKSELRKFLQ